MWDNIISFFKKFSKESKKDSKDTAKERLHLVLMQDRANVSADFLEMMKQEIIEVIKKYIDVDENSIDVKLTNKVNSDGTTGAPALYANIPIVSLKDETKKLNVERQKEEHDEQEVGEEKEAPVSETEKTEGDVLTEKEGKQENKEEQESKEEKSQEKIEEKKETQESKQIESEYVKIEDNEEKIEVK